MSVSLQTVAPITAIGATPFGVLQNGDVFALAVNGTFGGTAVTLEILGPDGANYIPVNTAMTVAGIVVASLPAGTYRLNVVGGAAMSINAFLRQIG